MSQNQKRFVKISGGESPPPGTMPGIISGRPDLVVLDLLPDSFAYRLYVLFYFFLILVIIQFTCGRLG